MKKFGCVAKRKQFNDFWNFCILFESTANWQIQLVIICTNENKEKIEQELVGFKMCDGANVVASSDGDCGLGG